MNKEEKKYIEVWGDSTSKKDLLLTIAISIILMVVAVVIAPNSYQYQLLYGLSGAVIGFVINILLTKPKRIISRTRD